MCKYEPSPMMVATIAVAVVVALAYIAFEILLSALGG